jgi:hypothetical protein
MAYFTYVDAMGYVLSRKALQKRAVNSIDRIFFREYFKVYTTQYTCLVWTRIGSLNINYLKLQVNKSFELRVCLAMDQTKQTQNFFKKISKSISIFLFFISYQSLFTTIQIKKSL